MNVPYRRETLLMVGFTAMVLLFAGLAVYVAYTDRVVADRVVALDEAFEETAVQPQLVDAVAHLLLAMQESRLALHELLLGQPSAADRFASSLGAFDEHLAKLTAVITQTDPTLLADLDEIAVQHAHFHEDAAQMITWVSGGESERATAFLEAELEAELQGLVASLERLEAAAEANMVEATARFDAQVHEVVAEIRLLRGLTAVFLLLGIVAAIVLSRWLGRLIQEPIAGLVETAVSIEQGDFDLQQVAGLSQRQDEFGQLARVFHSMATEVKARETALKQQVQQLQISIDRSKQQAQVAEITETDFFKELEGRAAELRRRRMG